MKFFEKTKGAISIFLVIILVPMMTVSSLFVDASKVQLARAMAEAAGDLTLNTALTNYDTDLKKLYGLLATAQDTSDLFSKLEEYYRTCITSAGVSDEEAKTYAERIMAQLGIVSANSDVSDLMNMELVDFSVQKYTDADLANATILKKQIVDFMKYRAPINTGLNFVSSLKSFSTLSKQSELVEKKQEYYKAQQTVLEDLQKAWSYIALYNGSPVVTDSNYLTSIKPALDGYADDYQDYGKRTIMSLYQKYNSVVAYQYYLEIGQVPENKYDIKEGALDEKVEVWTISYDGESYYSYWSPNYQNPYDFDQKKFPTVSDVSSAIKGFYNATKRADNTNAPSYGFLTDYNIQFMAQKKQEIGTYTSAELQVFIAYQKLKNVELWLEGYDKAEVKDEDGEVITKSSILSETLTIDSKTKTLSEWLDSLNADSVYATHMDNFDLNADNYTTCSAAAAAEYEAQWKITETKDIDVAINEIYNQAKGYVTTLDTAIENLGNAITYLGYAKSKLSSSVASAKTAWNNVATDNAISDTSLAKQDQAEINQLDTYLNETNITKLVTRLENIKTDLTSVRDQVKNYKFAGKFIGDIDGYSGETGLETAVGSKWSDLKRLPIAKDEVTNTATTRATSAWSAGNIQTNWITQSAHQPDLLQDKVSMYTYLSSHFAGTDVDSESASTTVQTPETEDGENFYENIKKSSESAANTASNGTNSGQAATETSKNNNITLEKFSKLPSKDTDVQGGSDTPSSKVNTKIDGGDNEQGAAGKSANALSGLFGGDFLSAISDMAEGLRDRLYVSDYIMSMFSYDTIENEYLKENPEVTEITEGMLQTLTKNDISEANNYAYGSEIEYILYGGTNSENLGKAYGTIYAIRFGFNLVYAFATSEIRDSALAIATPISAATLGVIPVPLIQAVIIIGIACCESAIDLSDLRNGEKVQLYKSAETWRCSITGLTRLAKDKVTEVAQEQVKNITKEVTENVVSKGVKALNDVLDMTDEELTKCVNEKTEDILAAVTSTYDTLITENAMAAIQQLTVLMNSAVESVSCLGEEEDYDEKKKMAKDWVREQLQSWAPPSDANDIASKIKRKAVEVIVSSENNAIDLLFTAVEESLRDAAGAGTTIDELFASCTADEFISGKIMETVESIRSQIVDAIQQGESEILRYKEEMKSEVEAAIARGAESLKETINSQIDGIFPASSTNTDAGTSAASFFSFSYSDYLRLFLLIGMYANEEKIILRTADVIQANMAYRENNYNYRLENSVVYVTITAKIQVKPTLIALPLFADVSANSSDDSNWYTITYTGISGY